MFDIPATVERKSRALMRAALALGLGIGLALGGVTAPEAQAESQKMIPASFADIVEKISPAVVNITTTTLVEGGIEMPMVPKGSPFEDFFKDFLDRNGEKGKPRKKPRQRATALGSGFIISPDGYIVTNNHVVDKADEIQIEFYSGERLDAKVIGTDPLTDIAVLKVESEKPLPYVEFADSDKLRVGDWVLAIGNPLGQGFSVSAGIVSARNRSLRGAYDDFIQTDAAINKGNSGGPLFNLEGKVVGVNTAILSPTGGSIGIGFSMASNVVRQVVDQLIKYGETRRGWLGVQIQDVTDEIADAIGLKAAQGALVTDVFKDSPADKAGIKSGDVIIAFNGEEVDDTRKLVRLVASAEVGAKVPVTVWRDGRTVDLTVKLGRREEAEPMIAKRQGAPEKAEPKSVLGLTVAPLDDAVREKLGFDADQKGLVIVDVDPASRAAEKGLRAGDVIVEAGQEEVATIADLERAVKKAREAGRKSVLLLVRRDGRPRFVALPVAEG